MQKNGFGLSHYFHGDGLVEGIGPFVIGICCRKFHALAGSKRVMVPFYGSTATGCGNALNRYRTVADILPNEIAGKGSVGGQDLAEIMHTAVELQHFTVVLLCGKNRHGGQERGQNENKTSHILQR